MSQAITLAVGKGRILKSCLNLLESIDIRPTQSLQSNRKLLINTNRSNINLMLVRSIDLPIYIRYGVASLGIVGKDILLEQPQGGYYELLDLGISPCRLMLAAKAGFQLSDTPYLKVASKFSQSTQRWFSQKGIQVDLIQLHGAMELAVSSGLADAIVDLVDTGSTLAANQLVAYDTLAEISARLIVNDTDYKYATPTLNELIKAFESLPVIS